MNFGELLFFLVHRELKEGKTTSTEPQPPPTDVVPELPAGLLGLEIPPEVRNVLKVIEFIYILTIILTPCVREHFCIYLERSHIILFYINFTQLLEVQQLCIRYVLPQTHPWSCIPAV